MVRRLLSLRGLLEDMSGLDQKMSSQVDLLLRALRSGVDLAGAGEGEEEDEEDSDGPPDKEPPTGAKKRDPSASNGGGAEDESGEEEEEAEEEGEGVDEDDLEEEEARFMGGGEADGAEEEAAKATTKKKRRRAAREKALADARAQLAAGGGTGDASLGDFGDDDIDMDGGEGGGSGGANILQGMVNRISQRDQATTARKGRGLQGDLDVPIRERDQTIRVRRPAPGEESESEDGGGGGGNGGAADSSEEEDDFMGGGGGGGFMDGLPPGLLEGLSRRGGGGGDGTVAAGAKKKKKSKSAEGKRGRGADGEGEEGEEEDEFYATVAEEKERKKRAKKEKYHPQARIAGALEAELEAERAARGETKRGASYTIIKNRGLTPHKNKLNRNPRSKKREAFRKATIRRKGQVREQEAVWGRRKTSVFENITGCDGTPGVNAWSTGTIVLTVLCRLGRPPTVSICVHA